MQQRILLLIILSIPTPLFYLFIYLFLNASNYHYDVIMLSGIIKVKTAAGKTASEVFIHCHFKSKQLMRCLIKKR